MAVDKLNDPPLQPTLPQWRPRILIVEGDPTQRALMREALVMHYGPPAEPGIVAAASAAECLSHDLNAFDAILMDYKPPDSSGPELLDRILTSADVPVIVVTGETSSAAAAEAIAHGAMDYVVKLGDYLVTIPVLVKKSVDQYAIRRENQRLQRRLEDMLRELQFKNQQLEESLEKLQTMAATDHLTGLANRRRFADALERYFNEASRYRFDLTCCMIDLDYYKQLNDTLGHQVGDEVLTIAADVVKSTLRASDVAARYGGDEFVLLLPHTSIERGLAVANRIRRQLALKTRRNLRVAREVTVSVGVASLMGDRAGSADALLAAADRALYQAKQLGRDRVVTLEMSSIAAA